MRQIQELAQAPTWLQKGSPKRMMRPFRLVHVALASRSVRVPAIKTIMPHSPTLAAMQRHT